MVHKPSTHRQTDAARSSPASGGERERLLATPHLQLNNVAGVTHQINTETDPESLYFGNDYLVLNAVAIEPKATSVLNIGQLFGKENGIVIWNDLEQQFTKESSDKRTGIRTLYLTFGRHKILAIEEIGADSHLKMYMRYPYDYRISFYSAFFCNVRLELLRLKDFFGLFLEDIEHGRIKHSVSRLDVCADLRGITPIAVRDGIEIFTKDKAKKDFGYHGTDKNVTEAETITIGGKHKQEWHARIYDKFLEISIEDKKRNRPSKEDLFPDYYDHLPPITRVEVQLNGSCRTYGIDLKQALDIEVQLGLFLKHLDGKYCKWKIAEVVRRAMRDRGFAHWEVKNKKLTAKRISNMNAFWLYRKRGLNLANRCSVSLEQLNTICEGLLSESPPEKVLFAGCEQLPFGEFINELNHADY